MANNAARADLWIWPTEPVQLPALYFIEECSAKYQSCTITGISRSGAAILSQGFAFLKESACCRLELIVPQTAQPLSLRGQIRVKDWQPGGLFAGIQFAVQFEVPMPKSTFALLREARPLLGWHSVLQKQHEYAR